ncbi:MAG: endonuclease NucS [bacterium]
MRLVIARCSVDYIGRLTAHLPEAWRLLLVKADGSVLVHADGGSYKPLNWMSPPCVLQDQPAHDDGPAVWTVSNKTGERLVVTLHEVRSDTAYELGPDPGLVKDGVEAHLQELLAEHITTLGAGLRLVRREYPTAIGPVDLLARLPVGVMVELDIEPPNAPARHVAVEIKRRATIDAVEQLTRYVDLLNRDPLLKPVRGILAAQSIAPQARTLAEDRGIACVVIDYDALRGVDTSADRLF